MAMPKKGSYRVVSSYRAVNEEVDKVLVTMPKQ